MLQIIDKPSWLKSEDIEFRAAEILRQYEDKRGPVTKPPIPIEQLIEGTLELTIDWCQIAEKPGEVILACIDPQERTIRMNETHRNHFEDFLGSETFTLGHEAGHWVLHVQDSLAIQMPLFDGTTRKPFICRGVGSGERNSHEWQANRFAAALLMPKRLLRDCAAETGVCDWPSLYRLRDQFGVSISALTRRLTEMNLLYVVEKHLYPNREAFSGQNNLV